MLLRYQFLNQNELQHHLHPPKTLSKATHPILGSPSYALKKPNVNNGILHAHQSTFVSSLTARRAGILAAHTGAAVQKIVPSQGLEDIPSVLISANAVVHEMALQRHLRGRANIKAIAPSWRRPRFGGMQVIRTWRTWTGLSKILNRRLQSQNGELLILGGTLLLNR